MKRSYLVFARLFFLVLLSTSIASGQSPPPGAGGVTFADIAAGDGAGIDYRRTRSARDSRYEFFFDFSVTPPVPRTDIPMSEIPEAPQKSRGAPGVCLFDYDNDGDIDIYVTNGPGTSNSLYSSQLVETGALTFLDIGDQVGAGATDQDSTGCVAGDIDNDGDKDLYVLSSSGDNLLLEQQDDGTFLDITASSGTSGAGRSATSATLGDVNNDGLLDIAVGNIFDMSDSKPIFVVPTDLNQHNQLFINQGNNVFLDTSQQSGIENLAGMLIQDENGDTVPIPGNPAGITWSIAMVDYDLDGDIDLFTGDDQAAIPPIGFPPSPFGAPNADRGLVHVFRNDGAGRFDDVNSMIDSPLLPGSWMGLSFADYNHDGRMDFFNSNFGDANISLALESPLLGFQPSRWFFGDGAGGFVDALALGQGQLPGVTSTPFGWGTSSVDYDNDGDTDILFVGDIQAGPFIPLSNPVAILNNDGAGNFSADLSALTPEDADAHKLRAEHGMATGDLNNDGFVDFVSASNFSVPAELRQPQPPLNLPLIIPNPFDFGGPWDAATEFSPVFAPNMDQDGQPTGTFSFIPALLEFPDGVLSVEINNADNGNRWVQVQALGAKGLNTGGTVNRDGIGAVIQFTPKRGNPAMQVVSAGAGYASQDSLIKNFGLGDASQGHIDILWPGGVKNRLYNVKKSEKILFPEIPFSIDTRDNFIVYFFSVAHSLTELEQKGAIDERQARRFLFSAVRAFFSERYL